MWDNLEVVIRDKGRITLPIEVREALALREGDKLELTVEKGAIILKPKHTLRVRDLKGVLGTFEVDIKEVEEAAGKV